MGQSNTAPTYWWTYTGYKGHTAHLLAHETEESAEFHHGMAKSLGGPFDTIGISHRAVTEAEARAGPVGRFKSAEVVNPIKNRDANNLAQALPALNPTATADQHAKVAARMVADMEGGAL